MLLEVEPWMILGNASNARWVLPLELYKIPSALWFMNSRHLVDPIQKINAPAGLVSDKGLLSDSRMVPSNCGHMY